jgi:Flp pilus assembly protein CpaB
LKRSSNRLVLLVGIFLAVVSFGGILLLLQGGSGGQEPAAIDPPKMVVIAKEDLVLGTVIRASQLEVQEKPGSTVDPLAFADVSLVAGKTVRQGLGAGGQVTSQVTDGKPGQIGIGELQVPPGKVAIAVQVDQVTGVGTVINAGDYVDVIVGFTGDKFPVVTLDPTTETLTVVAGLNSTSVKALIQGAQVLGTLLPPPPAQQGGEQAPPPDGTSLTGQQQIVIIAVTTKQAEVIKFAQLDGTISLVLRSSKDFTDPATGEAIEGPIAEAPGVVLKSLVDEYGVLVPELVEAVLPTLQGN